MVVILVVSMFAVCLLAATLVQARHARVRTVPSVVPSGLPVAIGLADVLPPPGLFLDAGHTWVALEPAGTLRIGMDLLARKLLGKIDRLETPERSRIVRRGERLFSVTHGGKEASFLSPVSGTVVSLNDAPEAAGRDAYGKGWVLRVKPENLSEALGPMRLAEEARSWLSSEIQRVRECLTSLRMQPAGLGAVSPDGGDIVEGVMEHLDAEGWESLARELLAGGSGPSRPAMNP
jgi:glycine cleavage system H protein